MRKPKFNSIIFEHKEFPEDVIVETHAYCNLKCIMCPYPNLKRAKGEMEFSVFAKIVDEIAKENPTSRLWVAIMGEPLLGKNLLKMINYASSKGITNVHLNTNATFLTKEKSHKLLNSGIKELLISFDAFTRETYDRIRVGGDFPTVVKNVEYLLEEKARRGIEWPHVIAQFIIMDQNEEEVVPFKKYWLSKGAVVKVRLKLGWGDAVKTEDLDAANLKRTFPCPWLLRTVSIHWNGLFAQCDGDYEAGYSPGDIRKQTIKEVWNGELAQRRAKHWKLDFSHPLCQNCKDWSVGRATFYFPEKEI